MFYTAVDLHCFIGVQLICNLQISVTPIKHIKKLNSRGRAAEERQRSSRALSLSPNMAGFSLTVIHAGFGPETAAPSWSVIRSKSLPLHLSPLQTQLTSTDPPSAEPLACNARVLSILHLKHREREGVYDRITPTLFPEVFGSVPKSWNEMQESRYKMNAGIACGQNLALSHTLSLSFSLTHTHTHTHTSVCKCKEAERSCFLLVVETMVTVVSL